nr:MAG TPA: hypothetical protein [Caudoviricetes sp.]
MFLFFLRYLEGSHHLTDNTIELGITVSIQKISPFGFLYQLTSH